MARPFTGDTETNRDYIAERRPIKLYARAPCSRAAACRVEHMPSQAPHGRFLFLPPNSKRFFAPPENLFTTGLVFQKASITLQTVHYFRTVPAPGRNRFACAMKVSTARRPTFPARRTTISRSTGIPRSAKGTKTICPEAISCSMPIDVWKAMQLPRRASEAIKRRELHSKTGLTSRLRPGGR
jgi:hypothetical protein